MINRYQRRLVHAISLRNSSISASGYSAKADLSAACALTVDVHALSRLCLSSYLYIPIS